MGVVASIIAAPVALEIVEDEVRREHEAILDEAERLRRLRAAELYRLGDVDLELIKRYGGPTHLSMHVFGTLSRSFARLMLIWEQ